ncbi:MAG TPA: Ig-like domain-containing protein [Candidatus Polarisedimenticolia bacterium]|nr:Ig-like domain-containing protein [Candidatus Polarisedimenticolia bacterium]
MKTKVIAKLLVIAANLLTPALSVRAVDLLAKYPTDLTAGDTNPEHAQPWDFTPEDIFHVSQFNLGVGDKLTVTLGSADLGIGHSTNGAVWAVLIPREQGTLSSSASSGKETVANVWLRFHPSKLNELFPPDTVSADGDKSAATKIRGVADAKFHSSWHAGMNATIPGPKDLTVYVDTKTGVHRFFVVDTEAKTAEYIAAFNRKADGGIPVAPSSIPPVVVKTVPEAGATDVPPGETEIKVTFSKPMKDGSWSWATAWQNSTPEIVGKPAYDADGKTCVVKVKLEPNKSYGFWLNSQSFHNFKDKEGHAAVPYLLVFQTKSE